MDQRTLFCVLLFVGTLGSTTMATAYDNNAAILLTFYRVVYPVIVRMGLIPLPAIWGMSRS